MSIGNAGDLGAVNIPLENGYILRTRLDFSGHLNGRVDPHENTEVINPYGQVVRKDLSANQIPGMNGMQNPPPIMPY